MSDLRMYLEIERTDYSPKIKIGSEETLIQGESRPENPGLFYKQVFPLLELLHEKAKNGDLEGYTFKFYFDYLSSSSLIVVKKIFIELAKIQKYSDCLTIVWMYYSLDEEIRDLGLEIAEITGLNLSIHSTTETC